jgi:predicted O-methyltransferase YrrM
MLLTMPLILLTAIMAVLFAAVLVLLLIAHKVRRVHLMLFEMRASCTSEVRGTFTQSEALLGLYLELGFEKGLPSTRGWAASPDFLLELARYARSEMPSVIVECSSGVSTLVLARCAQLNGVGHVYSLEHDTSYAAQTTAHLNRHGLQDFATVIHAPLQLHTIAGKAWRWYSLHNLPHDEIDLLVIDGPPSQSDAQARYPAGPLLIHRMRPGAAVFLDDATRQGEQAVVERWKGEFGLSSVQPAPACEKGCAILRTGEKAVPSQSMVEQRIPSHRNA